MITVYYLKTCISMLLLYILFDCDKHYILCWEVFIHNLKKNLYLNYIISFLTEVRYNNMKWLEHLFFGLCKESRIPVISEQGLQSQCLFKCYTCGSQMLKLPNPFTPMKNYLASRPRSLYSLSKKWSLCGLGDEVLFHPLDKLTH